jgi:predicted transcriptional regulator
MKPKYPTSIRLSDEVKRLLDKLADKLDTTQAEVIARALRELAKKEKIE